MSAPDPLVRLAIAADAVAIARIHNHGIEDRIATFQIEPRAVESVARHLAAKGDRYPTLVVVAGGEVVAYAGAGAYRDGDRPWYAGIAEHSVYVDRAARGRGYGRLALDELCRVYEERGFWKLLSRIFPKNEASLALHKACGFRVVGVYERHGRLDGVWHDCVIVERLLGEAARADDGAPVGQAR